MWRYAVGGVAALLLVAAGIFLFNTRATTDRALPAAPPAVAGDDEGQDDVAGIVPEATRKTREQKRFGRYDKDRNGAITREEYLTPRRKAFAKLDANHDGTLGFDEWAVKTEARFAEADKDKSGAMSPAEFAATAPKRTIRARCACQPAAKPTGGEDDN